MDQTPPSNRPRISAIWRWAMPLISAAACGLFGLGAYQLLHGCDWEWQVVCQGSSLLGLVLPSLVLSVLIAALTLSQWRHFSLWLRLVALLGLLPLVLTAVFYGMSGT
jgi:hypothetical protein